MLLLRHSPCPMATSLDVAAVHVVGPILKRKRVRGGGGSMCMCIRVCSCMCVKEKEEEKKRNKEEERTKLEDDDGDELADEPWRRTDIRKMDREEL